MNLLKSETAAESPLTVDSRHLPMTATPPVTSAEEARIAAFLDAIVGQLAPLPPEMRGEVRRELGLHLASLIAANEELGATREAAIGDAMRQFGDSRLIARRFRRAWRSTETYVRPWAAMRLALATFGLTMATMLASMLGMARFLQFHVGSIYGSNAIAPLFLSLLFGLPLLAGAIVGQRSPRRAGFGTFCALAMLTLATFPLLFVYGFDNTEQAITFAGLFRLICAVAGPIYLVWLPLGCLSASIACTMRTRLTRRRAFR